jgi:hypothetical protein
VLVIGVALLGANRLSSLLFERPIPLPAAAPVSTAVAAPFGGAPISDLGGGAAEVANLFRLVTAQGQVETYRDGQWSPIPRGDLLRSPDVVRTSSGARAVLSLGPSTEIELKENVEIRLDRLSKNEVSVDLLRGKVFARVPRAGDHLTVTASDTRASNEGPTHFIVKADESGRVSVAATEGSVRFISGGKEVLVRQGSESRAERGTIPADPERIPEEILLSVVWPQGEWHTAKAPISGTASPSSAMTINGASVSVGADGRFSASVPLRPGANEVHVEAEDLTGRRTAHTSTLMRSPPQRPELTPVPSPLWNP